MEKTENAHVVTCPPCGENVGLPTKRGLLHKNALWPRLPRLTAVLPPQGREMTIQGFTQQIVKGSNLFTSPLAGEDVRRTDEGVSIRKPHYPPLTRPSATLSLQGRGGDCRVHSAPQGARKTAGGFTLIELLVVVLILGILAAVALPQYQKAVFKSRLTQVDTGFNAFMKGVDLWLLENGWPQETTLLPDKLDINMPCSRIEEEYCYLKTNEFYSVFCYETACGIYYDDGPTNWLKDEIDIGKYKNQYNEQWVLDGLYVGDKKSVCQWWASTYGTDRMRSDVKTQCAALGVE